MAPLSPIRRHVLEALRANASGAILTRPDGSAWRAVSLADADLEGSERNRLAIHFRALREAGLFEPLTAIGRGLVRIDQAKTEAGNGADSYGWSA